MKKLSPRLLNIIYTLCVLSFGIYVTTIDINIFWKYFIIGIIFIGFVHRIEIQRKDNLYFSGSELMHSLSVLFIIGNFYFYEIPVWFNIIFIFMVCGPILYNKPFQKFQKLFFRDLYTLEELKNKNNK
jgi:hypothetical protein